MILHITTCINNIFGYYSYMRMETIIKSQSESNPVRDSCIVVVAFIFLKIIFKGEIIYDKQKSIC